MNLGEKFNQEVFLDWIDELLPSFQRDIKKVDIPKSFLGVSKIETLGESSIGVRVFVFQMDSDPIKKRITFTKDSFNVLKNHSIQNAVIAYYSPDYGQWRLSFLTSSATWENGKIVSKLSNLKRQSFVVGEKSKVKTPTKYLANKIIDLNDLKKRFSIEVVNKDFYKEISKAFNDLQKVLHLPSNTEKSQTNLEFSVRLIGRIIFCWFLREKKSENNLSLISNDLLSLNAIKQYPDYYHKILEPLFFEILNKQKEIRKPDEFDKEPFSQTPYLNGGLFSAQSDDFYNRGRNDFQSKYHDTLVVPDSWFEELFEVLETYNFTIDENTSYDEELSIDPEMLGRIFENLLAEINPETGESARKSTGSYYTPRVIVDYMVDESLLLYLKNKTEIDEDKLRVLISYDLDDDESNPLSQDEKEKIINALGVVKILDPACGSGAFPIGALQKIVFILQQIDPHAKIMYESDIKKTPPEFRKYLQEEFDAGNFDYLRKLRVIRESIYGVDIQPIATEISRLRCFLTLVVDQQIRDEREDRGIKPLPNLDFKFVTANSLIGLPKNEDGIQQLGFYDDREKIEDLKNTIDEYFNSSGIEREQLKTQFANKQKQLLREMEKEHGWSNVKKAELSNKLVDWEPFEHKPADWFDPEWMFGIKSGFDIVIANPPYSLVGSNQTQLKSYYKKNYDFISYKINTYILFIEKGLFLLKKQNGNLSYIVPKSLVFNTYFDKVRGEILKKYSIHQIDEFQDEIFEAAQIGQNILLFCGNDSNPLRNTLKYQIIDDILNWKIIEEYNTLQSQLLDTVSNNLYQSKYDITKVRVPYSLLSEKANISNGLNPGNVRHILLSDTKATPNHKEMILGKDIQRYKLLWSGTWVNFDRSLKNKLTTSDIKSKKGMTAQKKVDFALRNDNIYLPGKILVRKTSDKIISTFDNHGYYFDSLSYGIQLKSEDKKYLFFLLALLNSKFINYIHEKISQNKGKVFAKVLSKNLAQIPIVNIDQKNPMYTSVIDIVHQILINANSPQDDPKKITLEQNKLEKEIDQIVYKLYELTDEEIKIVEESFSKK